MPQLGEEVLNGLYRVLGLAGNTHVAAGPASQIGQRCGVRLLTVGSDDRKLTARMVERICNNQQVDRNVDRAGDRGRASQ